MLPALGRAALILALGGLMVAGAWWLANEFESPDNDLRAGIRAALADAYGHNPGRRIDLDDVVDDPWEQLYAFSPLTPRDQIDRTIAPAELDDSRDVVPADKSLVVLTRGKRVVASATVERVPIDISCVTTGENRAVTPDEHPAVVRTSVARVPILAATDRGERAARRCLESLPPTVAP